MYDISAQDMFTYTPIDFSPKNVRQFTLCNIQPSISRLSDPSPEVFWQGQQEFL